MNIYEELSEAITHLDASKVIFVKSRNARKMSGGKKFVLSES